jgi:hypothetical protein
MVLEAFRSSDSEIRRQALAPFDEIAVCRFPLEGDAKDAIVTSVRPAAVKVTKAFGFWRPRVAPWF